MFRRLLVISSVTIPLFALFAIPVKADAPYEFVTLYAPVGRDVVDLLTTEPSYRLEPRSEAVNRSTATAQRAPWEKRIPWWREEAIERGPLAPYDRQSTFERSLEAGRTYPEASRKYQRANDRDPVVGDSRPGALYDQRSFGSVIPLVAATLWRDEQHQSATSIALPKHGPVIRYKGISLIGLSDPEVDNDAFFNTLKKAVDMTATLPERLRSYTRFIETVIYDPPSKARRAKGAVLDFDGVYTVTNVRKKAPFVLYKDMRNSSPLRVAMSLLGGGIMAARHERLMALLKEAEESGEREREVNNRLASVGIQDPALVNEAECELQILFHEADKAFGVSQTKVGARLQLIRQRRCR